MERPRRSPLVLASTVVGFSVLYAVAMYVGRETRLPPSQLALAWPAAGVTMVWFLHERRVAARLLALLVITAISGCVNQLTGVEALGAWLFGPVNASQGWVGAAVVGALGGQRGPLRTARDVRALAAASVAGGMVSALSGGVVAWARFGNGLWEGIWLIGFRNALSGFVITAALLALPALRRRRAARAGWCAVMVSAVLISTLAMMQVDWPVAFALVPLLLLVALRCGTQVTAVTVAVQGIIVVVSTRAGHGAFAALASAEARVLVAQFFLLVLAVLGLVVSVQEEERRAALERSRRDRDRLQNHMEAALVAAGHVVVDRDDRIVTGAVNAALVALTARSRADLLATVPTAWVSNEDRPILEQGVRELVAGEGIAWRAQLRLASEWGGAWVDAALAVVDREELGERGPDGGRTWLKLQMIDITAQKQAELRLAHAALHDDLTGLPNRPLWMNRLDHAFERSRRSGAVVGVLYIDVDHFKQINDTYGHSVGDDVLREVASRLAGLVRPDDTVARIGGDEFVVLCPDVGGEEAVRTLAARIQERMQPPVVVDDRSITVTTSVGVALATADDADARTFLRRADAALYTAKEQGRARFEVHTPSLQSGMESAARLLVDLDRGIRADEFSLVYQPIVGFADGAQQGRACGFEALLRWNHPVRGLLRPVDFLDVLESSELVHRLGARVLRQACGEVAALEAAGTPLPIQVNVSARELARPGLVARVQEVLAASGLTPSSLVLEITETKLVDVNGSLVRDLFALRDLGVRIAVDDFGTGFSPLTHLVDLPVDQVKLDGSFVANIVTSRSARSVARGVLAMADGLDIEVVAEGVETPGQARLLRELGYDLMQGYYFGPPRAALDPALTASVPGETLRH